VEFGDYQCNSCTLFYRQTNSAVIANLVDTGKAKLLFKDFTLNDYVLQPTRGSTLAAEAAYCAGDQGKFWQYHDELYNNQKPEGTVWVSEDSLKGFAAVVGLDLPQFTNCLDSAKYESTVATNNSLVRELSLDATPTFIIVPSDGKTDPVKLVGAYPYASFEAVVNQLIAAG
jgi:protein-disulfide isomerase